MKKRYDKYGTPLCFDNGIEDCDLTHEEIWEKGFNYIQSTNNLDAILNDQPHYTDKRFANAQTIFGKEEQGLNYDYSDRLWEWNYNKAKESVKIANETGLNNRTARWYQKYLSEYFGREVELKHILAGYNVSNGYPYQCFGYKFKN